MKIRELILIQILLILLLLCAQIFWQPQGLVFSFSEMDELVITQLRLPRFLMAFAAGAALALAGFIMQWLVQNPMGDPYLLGTSGGASLGQVILIIFGVQSYGLALGASFLFASLASLFAFTIATLRGSVSLFRLLLSGLAISSFSVALSSALLLWFQGDHAVRSFLVWNLGSLEASRWWSSIALLVTAFVAMVLLRIRYSSLLVLSVGEERAQNLGVNISGLRKLLLLLTSVVVAASVTLAGPIGFVGLIVPHVVRQFMNVSDARMPFLLALSGGTFLALCDTIAARVFSNQFPVGLITSFTGIPLFIYLLSRRK